ncbi:MAG: ribosome maturation factor RimP [Actinomycetota bacterium]
MGALPISFLLRMDIENKGTVNQIWDVVEPYLAAEALELDDLELIGRGPGRTLRVVIDGDGGVDLDRIAEVSRGLSRLLDASTRLDGPYQLEVSSPGLERKLTRPSQYLKSVGREVVVKTTSRTVRGLLDAADDDGFSVKSDQGLPEAISYRDVVSARTLFRWERPSKPGGPNKSESTQ